MGPGASNKKLYLKYSAFTRSTTFRLTIVMAKPMETTKLNAVPLFSCGAVAATNAENCGESATTKNPQIRKNDIKIIEEVSKNRGDRKQHKPEIISAITATFLLHVFFDTYPPVTQPILPIAIIKKLNKETGRLLLFNKLK